MRAWYCENIANSYCIPIANDIIASMSTAEDQIRRILDRAESELRGLISSAAKNGDYQAIDGARMAAGHVREIIALVGDPGGRGARNSMQANDRTSKRTASVVRRTRQSKRRSYPKFYVRGGVLHKVGWSKKEGQEYVHKLPLDAYEQILRATAELSMKKHGPVTSDAILDLLTENGASIPIYQIYVTLALLRENGAVRKQGRDGYLAEPDVQSRAKDVWSSLEGSDAQD
jgi:hypothetical protein